MPPNANFEKNRCWENASFKLKQNIAAIAAVEK